MTAPILETSFIIAVSVLIGLLLGWTYRGRMNNLGPAPEITINLPKDMETLEGINMQQATTVLRAAKTLTGERAIVWFGAYQAAEEAMADYPEQVADHAVAVIFKD